MLCPTIRERLHKLGYFHMTRTHKPLKIVMWKNTMKRKMLTIGFFKKQPTNHRAGCDPIFVIHRMHAKRTDYKELTKC